MEKSSLYFDSILHKLAGSYPRSFTLEDLTALTIPTFNILKTFDENIIAQRESKAKIIEALILVNDQGYIVLNPDTDESSITLKGLIKINTVVFCN